MGIDVQIAYITNGYGKVQYLEEIDVEIGEKKMKLIDRDKLTVEILRSGNVLTLPHYSLEQIDNAPIIKAIPIEWIEEWQKKHEWEYDTYLRLINGIPKYAVERLLLDWEKENDNI